MAAGKPLRRFDPPGFAPDAMPTDGTPVVAFDPAFSPPFRVGWRTRAGGLFVVPGGGSREFRPERWWPVAAVRLSVFGERS